MFWEIPNSQYPQKINLGISQIPNSQKKIPKLGIEIPYLGIWEFWEFGNLGILGISKFQNSQNSQIGNFNSQFGNFLLGIGNLGILGIWEFSLKKDVNNVFF